MLQDDLNKLEKLIKESKSLSAERRAELQQLARQLRSELELLEKTQRDQAQSISSYAKLAAHETLRNERDDQLHVHALEGLKTSIRRFEATHPALTRVIQQICVAFGV